MLDRTLTRLRRQSFVTATTSTRRVGPLCQPAGIVGIKGVTKPAARFRRRWRMSN